MEGLPNKYQRPRGSQLHRRHGYPKPTPLVWACSQNGQNASSKANPARRALLLNKITRCMDRGSASKTTSKRTLKPARLARRLGRYCSDRSRWRRAIHEGVAFLESARRQRNEEKRQIRKDHERAPAPATSSFVCLAYQRPCASKIVLLSHQSVHK